MRDESALFVMYIQSQESGLWCAAGGIPGIASWTCVSPSWDWPTEERLSRLCCHAHTALISMRLAISNVDVQCVHLVHSSCLYTRHGGKASSREQPVRLVLCTMWPKVSGDTVDGRYSICCLVGIYFSMRRGEGGREACEKSRSCGLTKLTMNAISATLA